MGKLRNIFYLFFTLSFALTIQAQDSLYFFQYPGQRYILMTDVMQWGGGGFLSTTFTTGTVTSGMLINGLRYYYNPFFNAYMAYKDGRVYWNKNGSALLVADFSLPSGSSYTGSIPPGGNLTLTITKTAEQIKIYSNNYQVYFKKDLGIQRSIYTESWGGPLPRTYRKEVLVKEMLCTLPGGAQYYFKSSVNISSTIQVQQTALSPQFKINIQLFHGYGDFIASVTGNLVYSKPGEDTVFESIPLPFLGSWNYGATITAKDSLIRNGYRLHFHFTVIDACLIPNTYRLPATDGYEIRLVIPQSDWYNKLPDFRNFYQRSILSGSDTITTGEVSHKFLIDTVINSTTYKREELFGEMLYFIPGDSNYSAVFYKNVSGVMQEAGRDSLFFSPAHSTPIHYFISGGKVTYQSDRPDSTGGFISRIFHLKGGLNGDEELKYKTRTGPVLLVRYEPDGAGGSQKVIYRLTKVNNQGIITSYNSDDEKLTTNNLPTEFSISNNYPNPFNPSTKLRIATVENSVLTFTLFNSNGEEVSSFTKEYATKGNYEEEINLSGLPSGAWFLSVRGENGKQIKLLKLLYLK